MAQTISNANTTGMARFLDSPQIGRASRLPYAHHLPDGLLDLDPFVDHDAELRAEFGDDDTPPQRSDTGSWISAKRSSFPTDQTKTDSFTPHTMIQTPQGLRPITALRPGDLITTADNGPQPLLHVVTHRLGPDTLRKAPHLRPVQIKPMAFGCARGLILPPHHSVLLNLRGKETLVKAASLAHLPGRQARVMRGCRQITFRHLVMGSHQIIFANGHPTESFLPTPHTMSHLDPAAQKQLIAQLPATREALTKGQNTWNPVRPYCTARSLPQHLDAFQPVALATDPLWAVKTRRPKQRSA